MNMPAPQTLPLCPTHSGAPCVFSAQEQKGGGVINLTPWAHLFSGGL